MLDSSDQLRIVVAKEELNILLQHPGETDTEHLLKYACNGM